MPSDMPIDVTVRGAGEVMDDIEDAIVSGVRKSVNSSRQNSIGHEMRKEMQEYLRRENVVWSGELMESFDVDSAASRSAAIARVVNDADHAKPIDEGADYGDEGPPLFALLPWVISEMQGVEVADDGTLRRQE